MLEKWKQRAIQMNFKKAVLVFLAVSFVLVLGFSAVLYGNFKDRTDQWESAVKTSREYQNREKGDEQDDRNDFDGKDYGKEHSDGKAEVELEQICEEAHLSIGDIALIAGCGIIGTGLALWYWLLCMIWAYRKSMRMGISSGVWVLATFFFNLAAIAVLISMLFGKVLVISAEESVRVAANIVTGVENSLLKNARIVGRP